MIFVTVKSLPLQTMTAFTSCNPSSGEVCFTRPSWNPSALEVSLRQLRDAQGAWADLNVEQRAKRLLRLADLLSQQREALADLVTLEVGKRTSECLAEIDKSAQLIRYYAELAPELLQPLRIATQASRSGVAFEPLGLVLAVMP